ncbi:MAG TPA: glycosyltransferase family 4 protein [Chloroflexia bacterium]|nr:glycosyltransferase family 4 protein [Chloroflexia bacterium]
MKLLFVSNLYPPIAIGGYEQVCYDVAQALQARGHRVHVLTSRYRAHEAAEVGRSEKRVYRSLKLLTNWGLPKIGATPWLARTRTEVEWHNVRTIRRVIAHISPDAVMFWNGANLGRDLLMQAERMARVVYYLHDPWLVAVLVRQQQWATSRLPQRLARRVYHTALRAVGIPRGSVPVEGERTVFISRALRTQYERLGVDVDGSEVISNGLAPGMFSFRPQHILSRAPGEPHKIIFSGRITPEKGVMTLLAALRMLRDMPGLGDTRLSLLGVAQSEEYGAKLRDRIGELGLRDAARFLRPVPRHEIPDVYACHDLLAFTSEWEEPFALTLLEAMAVGVPVVSSLTGGSAEIVRDGENAFAFQAGDANDLASKLAWVLTHPQQAAAAGQAASKEIVERYTFDAQVSAIEGYLASQGSGVKG